MCFLIRGCRFTFGYSAPSIDRCLGGIHRRARRQSDRDALTVCVCVCVSRTFAYMQRNKAAGRGKGRSSIGRLLGMREPPPRGALSVAGQLRESDEGVAMRSRCPMRRST
jgi:hypothetical protein